MRATPKGVAYFFVRIREKRADFTPHCTALPGCWAFSFFVSYQCKNLRVLLNTTCNPGIWDWGKWGGTWRG